MIKNKKVFFINSLLIIAVIVLSLIPFLIAKDGEFGGADGEAEVAITEINPNYIPWFESFMEPASGEIESLLFALQAAAGTGVLAYGFGYLRGRSQKEKGIANERD